MMYADLIAKLRAAAALCREIIPDRGKIVRALLAARSEVTDSAKLLTVIDAGLRDAEIGDTLAIAEAIDNAGRMQFRGYDS